VSPAALTFTGVRNALTGSLGVVTAGQTVTVKVSDSSVSWTAIVDQPWVKLTNPTGAGAGQFTVSIADATNTLSTAKTASATVTVISSVLGASEVTPVTLTIDTAGT
jgi:hypothetical protein